MAHVHDAIDVGEKGWRPYFRLCRHCFHQMQWDWRVRDYVAVSAPADERKE